MKRDGAALVRWVVALAGALFGLTPIFSGIAVAQARVQCDTALVRRAVGKQGYARYGDRCEGVFKENVGASATIWIASFTQSFDTIDTRKLPYLSVAWPVVDREVRISARSVRRSLYYAMDTWRPPGDSAWRWPTTILSGQSIKRDDIGVLASASWKFRDTSATVYLPLTIRTSPRAADTSVVYSLVLYPTQPLDSVFVTLARVGADGRAQSFVKRDEPVRQPLFFAQRPLIVSIPDPGQNGIYSAVISARYAGGKILTIDPILFHHVARRPPTAGAGRAP
jgi:hypothetical protein